MSGKIVIDELAVTLQTIFHFDHTITALINLLSLLFNIHNLGLTTVTIATTYCWFLNIANPSTKVFGLPESAMIYHEMNFS